MQGCVDYFKVIDDAVDMPILIYNFPGRFGDNGYGTNPDTVGALIEAVPNVIGIKECSGKLDQTAELIARSAIRSRFSPATSTSPHGRCSAVPRARSSASSNVLPGEWFAIYEAAQAGDAAKVTELGCR